MSFNCSSETNRIDSNTVLMKYIVSGWLTLIFCIFGIITNIFTIIVLIQPRMRNSSTHVYLMALSACNIFLSAGLMINYSLKSIASYPELLAYLHHPDAINRLALLANDYEQFYARAAPFTTPLLSMLLLCSTYFTVLVSGDRYFLICWPSIAEKIRTRTTSLRLVLIVTILVNIYIFPHWFEYRTAVREIQSPSLLTNFQTNETSFSMIKDGSSRRKIVELAYGRLGSNRLYVLIYRVYLNIPITFVIPFTLLTFCNGSMIHKLLLIRRQKKRLGRRMRADIRITTMLIVIVLTFMLCRSINLFANLLVQFSPCLNKNSLHRFNALANLLIAFNGFVNFFLFAAFGQRFREMVLYIFFRRGQHPFLGPMDGISSHRIGSGATPTPDASRRQSRRYSTNDSDFYSAISRRRSSATMAILGNTSNIRPRSVSHSITNSSHLCIPTYPNGKQPHNQSNSSISLTESPFPNSSYQELQTTHSLPTSANNRLSVPSDDCTVPPTRISSPSCMKKKTDDFSTGSPHHVKFV